jgi:hypothetical protein
MEILKHRANTIESIDEKYGVEIDVRDHNQNIVLSHGYPATDSPKLIDYLEKLSRNSLIAINVKSCEIEYDLLRILTDVNHKKYFVFDFSIPYLFKATELNLRCAFRVSEYEKETYTSCEWVWVDCFHDIWYDVNYIDSLKNSGYHIAIVSPELHKRIGTDNEIRKIRDIISTNLVDAICTKFPEKWQ